MHEAAPTSLDTSLARVEAVSPTGALPERGRHVGRLLFFLILISFFACGSPDPPKWPEDTNGKRSQPPPDPPPADPSKMVVYLDVSGSMRGYVAQDGLTVFGRVLHELRQFTTTFDPRLQVLSRRVGGSLGEMESDLLLVAAARDPQVFKEADTDLVGALTRMAKMDPPVRYHILVTDGVMSTRRPSLAGCAKGSDQFCTRQAIVKLLDEKKWGGCVLGIRSQFKGNVYSEIKPLRHENPVIRYDSKDNDPGSYRPFYLFVFSPDAGSLDKFVEELKDRIRPLTGPDNLRELALTLPYAAGGNVAEIVIPKGSQDFLSRKVTINDDPLAPPRLTLRVSKDAIDSNPQEFRLNVTIPWTTHALATTDPEDLPNLVDWDLEPVYPSAFVKTNRYPKVTKLPPVSYSSGIATIPFTVYWPRTIGEPEWIGLRIVGRLALDRTAPNWVHNWSTDDDSSKDVGMKTFDLESAVLNLWRNDALKKQVVATVYLRVGPE